MSTVVSEIPQDVPLHIKKQLVQYAKRGIRVDYDPVTNAIHVRSLSDLEKDVSKFLTNSVPCWFDGCAELRKELNQAIKKEVEAAKSRTAKKGLACSSCDQRRAKNNVVTKYRPRIIAALRQHNEKERRNKSTREAIITQGSEMLHEENDAGAKIKRPEAIVTVVQGSHGGKKGAPTTSISSLSQNEESWLTLFKKMGRKLLPSKWRSQPPENS